ncbi:MAG: type II toxin-antitoxin system Phd/YefM family antitoxin [SAR202 cluster bacterium]|nr:type II toxin-antitoxin system Phd/YefM family antitoxin [SAR202 cluster bacterium]
MTTKIVNVSELKINLASLMGQLEEEGIPLYVIHHGKPKAVLVKYQEYEAILQKLEDLEDLLAAKEALLAPESEAITLDEYEQRRKAKIHR